MHAVPDHLADRGLPQERFTDLYSAVYELIDDAKRTHAPVKLYKGSHGAPDPHKRVTEFGEWFYRTRRGLLGFVCDTVAPGEPAGVDHLATYARRHCPRIAPVHVFDLMAQAGRRPGEPAAAYLRYVSERVHALGAYRGGSSGLDDEARAVAAAHFRQLGVSCGTGDVMIFAGGAKGVFLALCAAVMCRRDGERLDHRGGIVLAPSGYYQSLRLMPPLFGGVLQAVPALSGDVVADWLAATADVAGRIVYAPLVNNLDGRVLGAAQAWAVARAVARHNTAHPHNPCHLLGDDVYSGSYLAPDLVPGLATGMTPTPVGAVRPAAPWCVSVVTASKTFALPTARIAFAAVTNPQLRAALAHYRTVFSHGRVPQIAELTSAAALALTPRSWVEEWNETYRSNLALLTRELDGLNHELGESVFCVAAPTGGWYLRLGIRRSLFGPTVTSSVAAMAVALHYGHGRDGTGLAMLPGELFGHTDPELFTLRGNLAVKPAVLVETVRRLRDMALAVRGHDGTAVTRHALARARRAVPHLPAYL